VRRAGVFTGGGSGSGTAPAGGIACSCPCTTCRGVHIGQCGQPSVDDRMKMARGFQQLQGLSAADIQYGHGIRRVGTDQWQVWAEGPAS